MSLSDDTQADIISTCVGYCIVLNFELSGEKFKTCNNQFVAITL